LRFNSIFGWVLGIGLVVSGSALAFDKQTQRQCFADAAAEARTCVELCKDDFRADKDSCRNIDPTCGDAAREERESCVNGVLLALTQCVTTECAPFRNDIEACREQYPVGDPLRDPCVDNAQLLNFQCRDTCRESVQLHPSLKECRVEFRAAIKACPAPTPAE
jgi:hypothetical protein